MPRLALLLAALVVVSPTSIAAAVEPPAAWEVLPAPSDAGPRQSFDLTLDPGASIDDSVIIRNRGAETITVDVWATDAVTTPSGDLGLLAFDEEAEFAGSWITPASDEVTIPGRSEITVPFSVSVPAGEQPGDYVAGVVVSRSEEQAAGDGQTIMVEARVASRVYLRVPGTLTPSLSVTNVTVTREAPWWNFWSGEARVDFTVTNTGNARLSPEATVGLSGPFDLDLGARPAVAIPELLPGDSLRMSTLGSVEMGESLVFAPVAALGLLTSEVGVIARLTSGPDAVRESAEGSAVAIPWLPAAALLLLIGTAITALIRRRRKRARSKRAPDVEAIPAAAETRENPVAAGSAARSE